MTGVCVMAFLGGYIVACFMHRLQTSRQLDALESIRPEFIKERNRPDGDVVSHKYACSMHVADLLNELMAAANLIKNVAKAGSEAQN